MKRILVKNSLFSVVQTFINILLIFFTIPIFIRLLGTDIYGIFSLIMVVGNLNTFTSLGLTSALVKFVAEQGKTAETTIDIWVNLIIMIGITLPMTLLVIYFDEFILLDILKIPAKYYSETKWLYYWVLGANLFLLIGQTFKSVLDGMQKVYLTSMQQIIYNLLYWSLILTSLLLGFGLSMIGFSIFLSAFIWLVITIVSMLRYWGFLSLIGLRHNFRSAVRKQLNYGLKIYSSGLISFLFEPFSKILLSNFVGITYVGYYDIAMKIKGQLWGIISKVFYPLFPFISDQKNILLIRKYVHDLEQKTFLVVIPFMVMAILLMKQAVVFWIESDESIIAMTSIYLICFHLVGSATVIPVYQFLLAKNLAQKTVFLQLLAVILNTIFFFVFLDSLGFYALIVGNVIGIMGSFFLSLYYQKRYLDSLIFDSFSQFLRLIVSFCLVLTFGIFVSYLVPSDSIGGFLFAIISIVFFTMFIYRLLNLVRSVDIYRYFGSNNFVSKILIKIYSN